MNKIQIIAKNVGVLSFSQIVSYLFGFLYLMYTARYLGAEGFGILSFAIAFTGIFVVLADLGLNMVMVREIARDRSLSGEYLGNIIIIKIILGLITFFLIVLTVNIVKYPQETINVVYLIAISVIFVSFSGVFNSIFQANERMEYQSIGQILNSSLLFTGAIIAIYYGFGLYAFASINLIVSIVVLFYSLFICFWKFVLPKIEVDLNFWRHIISEALPFGLTSIFVVLYYYIDTVLLSIILPNANEVIGWYSAAYKLIIFLSFIPGVYFSSVFPVMSNFHKESSESLKFAFERSIKYMTILGVPIAAGITILADKIILLVYGAAYLPAVIALQILVWSVALIFIDSAFAYLFSSINKQTTVAKIMGIVVFVNIALNLVLIPLYSYVGASVVTLTSDIITLMLMVFVLSKTKYKVPISLMKNVVKVFIASFLMVISIIIMNDLNLFLIILISSIVYAVSFLLVKGLDKDDILLIKRLISQSDELENGK
jgi:O-antigen/teichoic acid export membrane protein